MCACSGHWTYDYKRGCKKASRPHRECGCDESGGGDIKCECPGDFCNGSGGWTTETLAKCSEARAARLKEDSSVGAVMIVDVVVLITGVVASQLLI